MERNLVAKSSVSVDAPKESVWKALIDPNAIKQYMFGADVESGWHEGDSIVWEGEFQGKKYRDKGVILEVEKNRKLQYSHFSPLSGQQDRPENYHTVTIELSADDGRTNVTLSQDNNPTEEAREHSEKNWDAMLSGLKKYVEQ